MDENQLIRETARAAEAETLLRSVVFQAAIATVRDEYTKAWTQSRPDDAAGREHAYKALHALDEVLRRIQTVIDTGDLAKRQLQRLNS